MYSVVTFRCKTDKSLSALFRKLRYHLLDISDALSVDTRMQLWHVGNAARAATLSVCTDLPTPVMFPALATRAAPAGVSTLLMFSPLVSVSVNSRRSFCQY